jgi:single-strand DNA-binding protein
MASFNRVILMGNLTRDPEMRYTTGGMAICGFGLATNRHYTTAQGQDRDEVCFVDVEAMGKQAESCNNYLRKGAPAFVEGYLRYDQWEEKGTGKKRSRLLVRADRIVFLGSPARDSRGFPDEAAGGGAPRETAGGSRESRPAQAGPEAPSGDAGDSVPPPVVDDIPF